jgi:hypothetical protein
MIDNNPPISKFSSPHHQGSIDWLIGVDQYQKQDTLKPKPVFGPANKPQTPVNPATTSPIQKQKDTLKPKTAPAQGQVTKPQTPGNKPLTTTPNKPKDTVSQTKAGTSAVNQTDTSNKSLGKPINIVPIDYSAAQIEYQKIHPQVIDSNAIIHQDVVIAAIIEPAVEVPIDTIAAQTIFPNFFSTEFSKNLEPKPRIIDNDAWILPVLLMSFFIMAIVNTLYNREIKNVLLSLVKIDGLKKIANQENTLVWRSLLLFLLLFLIVSPVFMYQTSEFFNWSTAFLPYLSPYFQLMLIGAGLLGLKILMIGFIGNLFYVQKEAAHYITGIVIMNGIIAALIIPLSLGIKLAGANYTEYILYAGLGFFALCYLYSIVNGLLAGLRSTSLSKFHLFLYFCTLEILPVFIIIKTVRTLI